MEYTPESAQIILNEAYTIQSFSDHSAALADQSFFFSNYKTSTPELLYVHAGGKVTCLAPARLRLASIPYAILILCLSEKCNFHFDGKELPLKENDLLLLPPNADYLFHTMQTPFSYEICFFSGTLFFPQLLELTAKDGYCLQQLPPAFGPALRALPGIEQLLAAPDADTALYVSTGLHVIFSSLIHTCRAKDGKLRLPEHVAMVKQILEDDYQNPHSLDSLSEFTGVSKYRLCRDFSDCIGIPPQKYLNQIRIAKAQQLLRTTSLTIHEIGSLTGMDNTNHFINMFKKNTGITPLQFRQNCKL